MTVVKSHFFSFSQAQYGNLAVYKQEEYFACSLKVQRSSIIDGKTWIVHREPYKGRMIVDRKVESHRS